MSDDQPYKSVLIGQRVATTKRKERIEGEITYVVPAQFLHFVTDVYVMWDDGVGGFHKIDDLELIRRIEE